MDMARKHHGSQALRSYVSGASHSRRKARTCMRAIRCDGTPRDSEGVPHTHTCWFEHPTAGYMLLDYVVAATPICVTSLQGGLLDAPKV